MKRQITDDLIVWRNKRNRLPLIIKGARQVGKTYIVKEFAKEYFEKHIYINFEESDEIFEVFKKNLDIKRILLELEAIFNIAITPGDTLIIFDEVQKYPKIITSLKYFAENAPQYHVVCAGSLFGVAINREEMSFPVGKVQMIDMYPLSFKEFLWRQNNEKMVSVIEQSILTFEPIPTSIHEKALELFKQYLIVGGLPASVNEYNSTSSIAKSTEVIAQIVQSYINDMSKYASKVESMKIRECFKSIPEQLAKENKKFKYSVVKKGGRSNEFAGIIEWLVSSGLVMKCTKLKHPISPISVNTDKEFFKLYMNDVGVLVNQSNVNKGDILHFETVDNTFFGAIAENYVASVLEQNHIPLHYWTSDAKAEVDFIIETEQGIVPVEVKKGLKTVSKSLNSYQDKFKPKMSIRISAKNIGRKDGLLSLPIYATEFYAEVFLTDKIA